MRLSNMPFVRISHSLRTQPMGRSREGRLPKTAIGRPGAALRISWARRTILPRSSST